MRSQEEIRHFLELKEYLLRDPEVSDKEKSLLNESITTLRWVLSEPSKSTNNGDDNNNSV